MSKLLADGGVPLQVTLITPESTKLEGAAAAQEYRDSGDDQSHQINSFYTENGVNCKLLQIPG
jgi:hypothetical protein